MLYVVTIGSNPEVRVEVEANTPEEAYEIASKQNSNSNSNPFDIEEDVG